jgi:hypothetical protein
VQQFVHLLTPALVDDRLVLTLAADELPRLIADAKPAIRKAWRLPPPQPSKSARRGGDVTDGRADLGYD